MGRLRVRSLSLVCAVLFVLALGSAQAKDAFSILEKLERNYVGLEKKGLNTVMGEAKISTFPDAEVKVYWSRKKGMRVKVTGGGPAAVGVPSMIEGFLGVAGLGMKRATEEHFLTPEKVVGKVETATVKGKKLTKLTFTPKKGQALGFDKLVMMIDTKDWLTMRVELTSGGDEVVSNMTYDDGLPLKIVSTAGSIKTEIENTYVRKGRVRILSKQTVKMQAPDIPEEQKETAITYSQVKINAKIPEDVFAEPEKTGSPKPRESAQELMQQAQAAMQQGDMATAKLKLRQIVTHYPDDPAAPAAKMMLEQLP